MNKLRIKGVVSLLMLMLVTSCSWTVNKKTVFTVYKKTDTREYLFGKYKNMAKWQYIIVGSTLDPDITLYTDSIYNPGDTLLFVKKRH